MKKIILEKTSYSEQYQCFIIDKVSFGKVITTSFKMYKNEEEKKAKQFIIVSKEKNPFFEKERVINSLIENGYKIV